MKHLVGRFRPVGRGRHLPGQGLVEFAFASMVFLLITIGTFDLGRAMYLNSQLTEATRDAVREAKTKTANGNNCGSINTTTLQFRIRNIKNYDDGGGCNVGENARPGLSSATVTYSCSPSPCASGSTLTINSSLPQQGCPL